MADIKKCTGLTKTSKPCNNKALIGKEFCQVHVPKLDCEIIEKKVKKEYKKFEGFSQEESCKSLKKDGKQCKRRGTDNGYCDKHRVSNELAQLVTKTCRECKKTKDITDFRKNRGECIDCERAFGRKYRQDNKEIAKKWTEENREHHNKLKSDWAKSHRDHINEKVRTRMHEDEYYKISKNYRSNLPTFLCGKSKKCKELVDCEKEFFVKWIRTFWEQNMNMENYGKDWVMDHVIPLHIEKDEFNTLAKWFNIMPVDKKYNLKKNKYIDKDQIKKHLSNLEKYCEQYNIQRDEKYFSLLAKHLDVRESLDF